MRINIDTFEPELPAVAGFIYTDLDGRATEDELVTEAFADMRTDYADFTVTAGFSEESCKKQLVVEVFEAPQRPLAVSA